MKCLRACCVCAREREEERVYVRVCAYVRGLYRYFELFQIFAGIDQGGDRRIDADEFAAAAPRCVCACMYVYLRVCVRVVHVCVRE